MSSINQDQINSFFLQYPNIPDKNKEQVKSIISKDFEITNTLYYIDNSNLHPKVADFIISYLKKENPDSSILRDVYTIKYFTKKKETTRTTFSRYISMNIKDYISFIDSSFVLKDNTLFYKKNGSILEYKVFIGPIPIEKYHRFLDVDIDKAYHYSPSVVKRKIGEDGFYITKSDVDFLLKDCQICQVCRNGELKKEKNSKMVIKSEPAPPTIKPESTLSTSKQELTPPTSIQEPLLSTSKPEPVPPSGQEPEISTSNENKEPSKPTNIEKSAPNHLAPKKPRQQKAKEPATKTVQDNKQKKKRKSKEEDNENKKISSDNESEKGEDENQDEEDEKINAFCASIKNRNKKESININAPSKIQTRKTKSLKQIRVNEI